MVYYTGNWHKDVVTILHNDNQKSYLAKMQKIQSDGGLLFFQKRMKDIKIGETEYDKPEVITGYQYIVMRERGTNA